MPFLLPRETNDWDLHIWFIEVEEMGRMVFVLHEINQKCLIYKFLSSRFALSLWSEISL